MKLLSRLVIALAICLMAIPMMATPVQAATADFSISGGSISKNQGYVGDEVRLYGAASVSKVYIYYELFNESDEDEWYIDYISGDWDSVDLEYDYSDYINIPESCMGEHEIRLCDSKDPDDDIDTLQFTVYPLIEIVKPTKAEGPAGTNVELKGIGWDENESEIEIRFYLEDPGTKYYDDKDYYVVVASEDFIGTFSRKHHRNIFCSTLAGKVAGNSTTYQGGVVALQLVDNSWQRLVVVFLGKNPLVMCRADMRRCNARRLEVIGLVSGVIYHAHHEGVEVGDFLSSDGSHQATVHAAAAERAHRDFLVCQ